MTAPSVQLYTVRDAVAADLPGAVARVAEIGFTKVEPYAFVERADEYAAALRRPPGVTAPSGHAPSSTPTTPERDLRRRRELGIETVIDPFIPTDRWQTADDAARASPTASTSCSVQAAAHGLALRVPQPPVGVREQGRRPPASTSSSSSASTADVVLEVDTFWSTVGGADTPALLRSLGDRVQFLHIKDGKVRATSPPPCRAARAPSWCPRRSRPPSRSRRPPARATSTSPAMLAAAPHALRVVEFDDYARRRLRRHRRVARLAAGERQVTGVARTGGRVGVGLIGAGVISGTVPREPDAGSPTSRCCFVADLDPDRARAQAEEYGVPGHGTVERAARDRRDRDRRQPHDARRARRGRPPDHRRRQARLEREAAGARPRRPAQRPARRGRRRRACASRARPTPCSAPASSRRMRAIARGDIGEPLTATTLFHVPGPDVVAPEPRVPLRARRRPAVRHGPVLRHDPRARVRRGARRSARSRRLAHHPHDRQRPPRGHRVPGRGADAPRGAHLRSRAGSRRSRRSSFQNALPRMGFVEISGTEGTIVLPDPNTLRGRQRRCGASARRSPRRSRPTGSTYGRGTGVLDLARAIRGGDARAGQRRGRGARARRAARHPRRGREPRPVVEVAVDVAKPTPLAEDWDPAAATL